LVVSNTIWMNRMTSGWRLTMRNGRPHLRSPSHEKYLKSPLPGSKRNGTRSRREFRSQIPSHRKRIGPDQALLLLLMGSLKLVKNRTVSVLYAMMGTAKTQMLSCSAMAAIWLSIRSVMVFRSFLKASGCVGNANLLVAVFR